MDTRIPRPTIEYLAGHSRGRWEGDTLVVDTTNFTDKTNFSGPAATTRQEIATRVAARRRALHAQRQEHHPLRVHGEGPGDVDQAVVR